MGKPRRKVSSAEVVARKKKKADGGDVSSNPFEVRVNRRKHDVLGQKMRSGRGLPGVARSRGIQKVSRAPHLSLSDSLCHCYRGRRLCCKSTALGTGLGCFWTGGSVRTTCSCRPRRRSPSGSSWRRRLAEDAVSPHRISPSLPLPPWAACLVRNVMVGSTWEMRTLTKRVSPTLGSRWGTWRNSTKYN